MLMDPAEELKALRSAVTRMQAESTKSLNRERDLRAKLKAAMGTIESMCAAPVSESGQEPAGVDWAAVFQLAKALGYPEDKGVSLNGVIRDAADRLNLRYWCLGVDGKLSAEALGDLKSWGLSADDSCVPKPKPVPPVYEWRYEQNGVGFLYRGSVCVGRVSGVFWYLEKPVLTIDKDGTRTTTQTESWVERSNEKAMAALLQRARELYDGEVAGK